MGFLFRRKLLCSNFEHLGATGRTNSFNCWFAILHGHLFELLNFFFGSAFDTIDLHLLGSPPFFYWCLSIKYCHKANSKARTSIVSTRVFVKSCLKNLFSFCDSSFVTISVLSFVSSHSFFITNPDFLFAVFIFCFLVFLVLAIFKMNCIVK